MLVAALAKCCGDNLMFFFCSAVRNGEDGSELRG